MKLAKLFKKKWTKYFAIAAASTAVISISTSFLVDATRANNLDEAITNNQSNQKQNNIAPLENTNCRLIQDPIINLDQKFANIYFDCLGNQLEESTETINTIKNALKTANYWVDGNLPKGTLDFEINNVKSSYKNPLLNFNAPAVKITPYVTENGVKSSLPSSIVTLVGFKQAPGQTHAINTYKLDFEESNNNASFVYVPKTLNSALQPLSGSQIKDYLFTNLDTLNTLFANLPTYNKTDTSQTSNGQFTLGKSDFIVSEPTHQGIEGNYDIYTYQITVNIQFLKNNGLYVPSFLAKSFELKVYYPSDLLLPSENGYTSTKVSNLLQVSNDITSSGNSAVDQVVLKDINASDFDALRISQPLVFKQKIINLLKSSSLNLPTDLQVSDIDITPINSVTSIYNDYGIANYNLVIKKVLVNNEPSNNELDWIKTNITIGGFKKTFESKIVNTYAVNGLDIANSFPSSLVGTDVIDTISQQTSNISKQSPSFVYKGTIIPKSNDKKAAMFGAQQISVNMNQASYQDKEGMIKNIQVIRKGFYGKNGILSESYDKFTINLVGFKTYDVNGITSVNNINLGEEYANYPAQSFLFPEKTRFDELSKGNLPLTPADPSADLIKASGNEIKQLILNHTVNLPQESIDAINDWQFKDLKINNFNGTITGKIWFPYYYELSEFNNNYLIKQNEPSTSPKAFWIDFAINGFSHISGATAISDLITQKVVITDDYGVNVARPANNYRIDEYAKLIRNANGVYDKDSLAYNTIIYWINNAKLVSNRWDTFLQQIENEKVGIQNIVVDVQRAVNKIVITFDFCYFNELGQFVSTKDDPKINPKVQIEGFKTDAAEVIVSNINAGSSIAVSYFGPEYANLDTHEFVNKVSTDTNIRDGILTDLITEFCVSNIDVNKPPVYEIRWTDPQDKNIPYNPDYPGSVFFEARFINNFFDNVGNFISDSSKQGVWTKLEINKFNLVSDTTLPTLIKAPKEFADLPASQVALNPGNIETLKNDILASLYNPKEGEIPNNEVIGYNFTLNNQNVLDGKILAPNGIEYFGEVNDVEGTITVYYVFKAGKWYKDFQKQMQDSEPKKIVINGFKKREGDLQWYKANVMIDTKDLSASAGNDFNELASNLINPQNPEQLFSKTLERMQQAGIINEGFNIQPTDIKQIVSTRDAQNANGSIVVSVKAFGPNVFDPSTGLYYKDELHPFIFDIYLRGFDKVNVTTYTNELFVGQTLNTPPTTAETIKNFFRHKETMNKLFLNSLPPAFTDSSRFNKNWKNYFFIPDKTQNDEDNIIVNWEDGSVLIKQMALLNYINSEYNLVFEPDINLSSTNNNWNYVNAHNPLILENVKLVGYKKMGPTTIRDTVEFNEYSTYTPSEFLENLKAEDIWGLPIDAPIEQKLIKKLIYNPPINDMGEENPGQDVNNLYMFFDNYNTNINKFAPVMEILPGIEQNNIEGTITIKLKVVNNFFYLDSNNAIQFQSGQNIVAPPIQKTVVIKGFKCIKPTIIQTKVNINNLNNYGNSSDPELIKNRHNLFWYNITDANGQTFEDSKNKILSLIADNISQFIVNPLNQSVNLTDYARIVDFNYSNSSFENGTLKFSIELNQYVSESGVIVDSKPNDWSNPLRKEIQIFGFKPYSETNPITGIDDVEININSYPYLQNLDYYCTAETLADALLQSPINEEGIAQIIYDSFKNIPPAMIFTYKDEKGLKDVEVTLNEPQPNEVNNGNAYRTGTITLKNVLVRNPVTKEVNIGTKTFKLRLTGFGNRTSTIKKSEIWDLSINYSDIAITFDNINATEQTLTGLLNTPITYKGNKDVSLFVPFFVNPKLTAPKMELEVTSIIKNNPSNGEIIANIRYKNYYKDGQLIQDWSAPEKISIKGFKINAGTSAASTTINSDTPIDITPSSLIDPTANPEAKAKLIAALNKPSNIEKMFINIPSDFAIQDVVLDSADDSNGVVNIKVVVINSNDPNGQKNPNPKEIPTIFKIINLNKYMPTEIDDINIELKDYFADMMLPAHPENIENLTPSEYVGYIQSQINIKSNNIENDNPEIDPNTRAKLVFHLFNSFLSEIVTPIYNIPPEFVPDFNLSYVPDEVPPSDEGGNVPTAFDYLPTLPFTKFTQAIDTNLFSQSILKPGQLYKINAEGKYAPAPEEIQEVASLYTSIVYNFINNHLDPYRTLQVNDRLGSITINFKVRGIWTFKQDGKNTVIDKTDGSTIENSKNELDVSLTINGFKKDVKAEEDASTAIIIASSVGGGLLVIIIVIVVVILIRKFGVGV